ncbi:hypothetical protein I7I50_05262 [Histoplasma capsulatum G186AR]|uniref:Uncharacterized protein n=1 Tax=Ajellomyces capsulatus TaxID=5037 RepID=A0A8H8D8T7_AJECA|nr:hypothetical protein I7I52_03521 [Histoplasma capsulatum]QSS75956.1 hypothetical protein I7I50_05262 [Histoplasma capsulatum G186AR]
MPAHLGSDNCHQRCQQTILLDTAQLTKIIIFSFLSLTLQRWACQLGDGQGIPTFQILCSDVSSSLSYVFSMPTVL